jgi:gamma-glutamyltranspeptidase/glutathione hydrolase
VLEAGGNAVDAMVAAALTAGVVAVQSCGIGGYGGHMVIGRPGGARVVAIDFNSMAPASAAADMFPLDEQGKVKGGVNSTGWLAAGVPGTLAGLQLALDRYGTWKLGRVAEAAIQYAREGFPVSARLAAAIKSSQELLKRDPGLTKLCFVKGQPLAEGERCRNPELADMLQKLADRGSVESFYRGDIAEQIARAFQANSGLVTARDLAGYQARQVEPLTLDWAGHTVYTAPLTAGGLTILQALAVLKALGWEKWDPSNPTTTQARLEALRIAWNDRLRLLGDPQKVDVGVERLLSTRYAEQSAERVRASLKEKLPVEGQTDGRSASGTIHLTAADAAGMIVSLTLTHGEGFGARVSVEGLGLVLGHGMSRFDPRPKHPNSPGPGKRPLHNMCPTVVCREGRPILGLGAAGGRRIPNTVFDVLAYRLGQGKPIDPAVQAPRLHTEGDLQLVLEASWPEEHRKYLEQVGYTIKTGRGAGLNAVERDPGTGLLSYASR